MNRIITVGREFGSGGREFGRRLAEELHIDYYDKEIITEIAKNTELSEQYIKQIIECKPHNLYPITIGQSMLYMDQYAMTQVQSVYQAQRDILCELAEKSSCVIVGRCADYILREYNPYRVFVYADMESRVRRCQQRARDGEVLPEKELRQKIQSIDKNRSKYYSYYTGNKWGAKENYDLCINTTDTEIKQIVISIARMFR